MADTKYFGVLFSSEKLLFRQEGDNEWERYIGEGEWEEVKGAKLTHESLRDASDYLEIDKGIATQIMLSFDNDVTAE